MDQPRNRHVPNTKRDNILHVCGLRWHGPISVVGAPRRAYGHAFVAPPRRVIGKGGGSRTWRLRASVKERRRVVAVATSSRSNDGDGH